MKQLCLPPPNHWEESQLAMPSSPTKENTSRSTRTLLWCLNHGSKNKIATLWQEPPLSFGEKHVTNFWRTTISHMGGASQLSTLSTPTSAWQASTISLTQTAQSTPTKKRSGRNNLLSQKLCSPRGNLLTTWSTQINASPSPHVFGTINTSISTSASNHKYQPPSSRICLSLSGAESYQETENSNRPETAEDDTECMIETTPKSSNNKNNGNQNKKRHLGNREIEKEREGNTKVKKLKAII
jgi:hypothetical protein